MARASSIDIAAISEEGSLVARHGTAEMDSPSLSAYSGALAEHNFSPLAERPPPAPVADAEPAKPGADFHTEQIASRPL